MSSTERRWPRMNLSVAVHMRFEDLDDAASAAAGDGRTSNVSREGLFIVMDPPKPVGTKVRATVSIGAQTFNVEGVVVRCVPDAEDTRPPDPSQPRGVAVFLTNTTADWHQFCSRLEQRRFEKHGVDVDLDFDD